MQWLIDLLNLDKKYLTTAIFHKKDDFYNSFVGVQWIINVPDYLKQPLELFSIIHSPNQPLL